MYFEQVSTDSDFSVCEIESIGFLVSEGDDYVVLCRDAIEEECRGVVVIPRENIISMRNISRVVE
mgnify:FL=1|tara:strand:+ start:183 stop:377 length:195 start_codon:yes stop_codon:yes gene_type:complete